MGFLIAIFTRIGLGPTLAKIASFGLLAALAVGGWLWFDAREKADDKANQEIGGAVQREADLRETVKNVEKANEAADLVRRDPDRAHAECLRTARTPANCQRFLPDSEAPDR